MTNNHGLQMMRLSTVISMLFAMLCFLQPTAAQHDPKSPGGLTDSGAAGRWVRGEAGFSRFHNFFAGPGEIKIAYELRAEYGVYVCAQVIDDKGRELEELNALEERRLQPNYGVIYMRPNPSVRWVGRYNAKRRQMLNVRVYHCIPSATREVPAGSFTIHVEGAGASFADGRAGGERNSGVSAAGDGKPLTLAQILTGLQSVGTTPETKTLAARNKFIVSEVLKRNISFVLTADREKDLRDAGASNELIRTLRGLYADRVQ